MNGDFVTTVVVSRSARHLGLWCVSFAVAMAAVVHASGWHSEQQLRKVPPRLVFSRCCPVVLDEMRRWTTGDQKYSSTFDGMKFFFSSAEAKDKFDKDPERYAPVARGCDLVLAKREGRVVAGSREYGAWLEGRIYLFANEDTMAQFNDDPVGYQEYLPRFLEQFARHAVEAPAPAIAKRPTRRPPPPPSQDIDPAPVMLNGYCPVLLTEKRRWQPGSGEFVSEFDGMRFHLSSAEAKTRFDLAPEIYAPAARGCDVVIAKDDDRLVDGDRAHGVWYDGHMFLFANEESLETFNKRPDIYLRYLDELSTVVTFRKKGSLVTFDDRFLTFENGEVTISSESSPAEEPSGVK